MNKRSKVAGPLVLWVQAQVKFAHLLDQIKPITKEIKKLKSELRLKQECVEKLERLDMETIELMYVKEISF